ncbi:MAG: DUF4910 domain-containing protein, partial [Pseudomonadota bacterium]|nr:DUF4910 domain-containing protein [Pseudomonadota bacterium]
MHGDTKFLDLAVIGERMYELISDLYPICRSITGNGVRNTLERVSQQIPLTVHEVPSGTPVFDWTVPREWNIEDAYVITPTGEKIAEFKKHNLHVLNYSIPVHKKVLWMTNLLLFGALILVVLLYFFWQADREHRSFYRHTREHTQLLAQVIQLNADNAIAAAEVVKKVAHTFMLNSARFIDYLDAVEPFTESELTSLALESGLNGITIDDGHKMVSGPPQWQNDYSSSLEKDDNQIRFTHNTEGHIFTLAYPREEGVGDIWLGFGAQQLETLQQQVGIEQLLKTLNGVPGITYVRLEPTKHSSTTQPQILKEIPTDSG